MNSPRWTLLPALAILAAAASAARAGGERHAPAAAPPVAGVDGRALLSALDLDRPGLEAVRAAAAREDLATASSALLDYYRRPERMPFLRSGPIAMQEQPGGATIERADEILRDWFTFQGVSGQARRLEGGGLDWQYQGPNGDKEWAFFLNRHSVLLPLVHAWRRGGDPRYAKKADALLRDWLGANPAPAGLDQTPPWRGMEAASRLLEPWPGAFYGLQPAEQLSPEVRLGLLASVPAHAEYLEAHHETHHNHAVKELVALAFAGLLWPEFRASRGWVEYAVAKLDGEIDAQFYPDGVHRELASHYHGNVLAYLRKLAATAQAAGSPLPARFVGRVARLGDYLARTMRPDGRGLNNNDSDLDDNRDGLLQMGATFGRDDWAFVATQGAMGKAPEGLPSVVYPWAGQAIFRSGWDAEARWSAFEFGPWGSAHQHDDALHLSVFAFGRDLLVDAGRFAYKPGPVRDYFVGSPSHNVVLVDGAGQKPRAKERATPMSGSWALAPGLSAVRGSLEEGFAGVAGLARHTRAVVHVEGGYWVVVDRIETDRPRRLTPLWHFHPEATPAVDGIGIVTAEPGKGNLRLVPAGGVAWALQLVRGRDEPDVQGWWSPVYNTRLPGTAVVFQANVPGTICFAWVLVPAKGLVPAVSAELLPSREDVARVRVKVEDGPVEEVVVRLDAAAALPVGDGRAVDAEAALLREGRPAVLARSPGPGKSEPARGTSGER